MMGTARIVPELRLDCKALLGALAAVLSVTAPAAAQVSGAGAERVTEASAKREERREWTLAWGDHPTLRFGKVIEIDFRARIQGDLRGSEATLDGSDTTRLDLARRRVGLAGVVADVVDFQIERELTDGEGWRDLYVNYRQFRRLELQAGQFKVPFGLDENTSSSNLDFVYRSRAATQLAPGRGRGAMAHGRVGILKYGAGIFTGDGDNSRGIRVTPGAADLTAAARFVVHPFRSRKTAFEDLQAGVAYTIGGVPEGLVDMRGDTALGQAFFRSEFAVHGARERIGVEARWRPGPFSLQSEFARLTNERLGQSIADTDLPRLVGSAWYLQGTWIVTGERKIDKANAPQRPLFEGGFGSIELAGRVEAVRFASAFAGQPSTGPRAETILPRSDRVVTLGVNWRPTRWIRVQANLVHDTISVVTGEAPAPPSSFWSRVVRFGFFL